MEAGGAVERAQSGDSDAFRLLVEQHSRAVFRLAFRMTGNEQDAEDVVQETFLRAYRQLDKYEARSSFSTWLYRIASNYSLDLIRMRKRHEDKRERGNSEERRHPADASRELTGAGSDRIRQSGAGAGERSIERAQPAGKNGVRAATLRGHVDR